MDSIKKFYEDIEWEGWYGDEPHVQLEDSTLAIDGSCITLEYLKKIVEAFERYLEEESK
jgi:hypothetical protein